MSVRNHTVYARRGNVRVSSHAPGEREHSTRRVAQPKRGTMKTLTADELTMLRIADDDWCDRIDFAGARITAQGAEVIAVNGYGIRAWIARLDAAPDDFEDGRAFVDAVREVDRETKSGAIRWTLEGDGLYEFGNIPTGGTSLTRGFFVRHDERLARLGYSRRDLVRQVLTSVVPTRRRRGEGM